MIFNIRDFIGDMCNLMAAKVRAAVASSSFEDFHKSSAFIIRKAIFGVDKGNHINDYFDFSKNCLRI
jgi:major vault protein